MTGRAYAEQLADTLFAVLNSKQNESNLLVTMAAVAIVFEVVGSACVHPAGNPPASVVRLVEDVRALLRTMSEEDLDTEHVPVPPGHFVPGPRRPQ